MDLFSSTSDFHAQPLAHRMRPRILDEYIGQDHIIGKGRLLRRAIQADQLTSIIFYGPPGTGKTTLARVIANTTKSHFSTMNAVLSGVKDLREAIKEAKDRLDFHGTKTILFVDEVHRWNKSQQDALLPWVENGTVVLIGATTENPYFEVNSALVSRSRIFQLKKLLKTDLNKIAEQALRDQERGYGKFSVTFENGALEHLVDIANGDARSLLNALQLAVETTPERFPPKTGSDIFISKEAAEESIQKKVVLYDKEGDYHFDVISAFIKSIRGSDPDAVLYWLARMVRAGEDPKYIFRRMLISASEDVGLADPAALGIVEAAAATFDRVGLPEGRFHLTQAALYLATAPKSNSALGFFDALKAVEEEEDSEVPNHLKDASRDKKGFGHGEGYLYPHAYRDHWVAQQYLPIGLQGKVLYHPSEQGFEKQIQLQVLKNREAQIEASNTMGFPEILTFSPPDKDKERWIQRLVSGQGNKLADIRERIFKSIELQRHFRVLVLKADFGMLLWEACRRTPEGGVYGITDSKDHFSVISHYAVNFPTEERPIIMQKELGNAIKELTGSIVFESIIGMNVFSRLHSQSSIMPKIHALLVKNGTLSLAEAIPSASTRLSQLMDEKESPYYTFLIDAERAIFNDPDNDMTNWNSTMLEEVITGSGFTIQTSEKHEYNEQKMISPADLEKWIKRSYYPAFLTFSGDRQKEIDIGEKEIISHLTNVLCRRTIIWKTTVVFIHAAAD
ncbi:MAG: AAA family ATPase [Spirochaetales bacterium]|nr:AAA family ATPase [Spirochaetales bacterium]